MTMYAMWIATDGRFAFSSSDNGGVEISDSDYSALFVEQQAGKIIANNGSGYPVATDEPEPTRADLVNAAESRKQQLLDSALRTTSIWQSELLLGTISDTDRSLLTSWIAYIKELQSIDISSLPITWPENPTA